MEASSLSATVGFRGGVGFAFDPTGRIFDPAAMVFGGGGNREGLPCEGDELLRPSNIPTSAPTPPSAEWRSGVDGTLAKVCFGLSCAWDAVFRTLGGRLRLALKDCNWSSEKSWSSSAGETCFSC